MRYFSIREIIRTILCSSSLGLVMGCLYCSLSALISSISGLLLIFIPVFRADSIARGGALVASRPQHASGVRKHVYDLIFFIILGLEYILLSYLLMDGVYRLYVLIPLIVAFFISKETFGMIFERIILFIYNLMYRATFYTLYILTCPLRIVLRFVFMLSERPAKYLVKRLKAVFSALRIRKKRKQINKFFKSITVL